MTEAEWLACTDPRAMLAFLGSRVDERKRRLFACACCRAVWRLLERPESRRAVEAAERYADGDIRPIQLRAAWRKAAAVVPELAMEASVMMRPGRYAAKDAAEAAVAVSELECDPAEVNAWVRAAIASTPGKLPDQPAILRDIFGNPFWKVPADPDWLTPNVVTLAETLYADHAFDRLPILADALMDADCADERVLAHCRSAGPHARGCWVIDLVRGRL